MKILWLDVETTGLDSKKNDIVSLAAIIDIDGQVVDSIYLEMQPVSYENISPEALKVNGYTIEQIKTFQTPQEALKKFMAFLGKHCNKFNKSDKYILGGHNVATFDKGFVADWAAKLGEKYLFSYLDYHVIDTVQIAMLFKVAKKLPTANIKLGTLTEHFKIVVTGSLHNSKTDIEATRNLYYKFASLMSFKEQE